MDLDNPFLFTYKEEILLGKKKLLTAQMKIISEWDRNSVYWEPKPRSNFGIGFKADFFSETETFFFIFLIFFHFFWE